MTKRNRLVVPQSEGILANMRNEIAEEMGITLGADATARQNGAVGGEMTKRLIHLAQQSLAEQNQTQR
ncbi:alpha/beta-type small acid-soluble spore protein [Priestia megaterium]|uniref:small, acid-soluble spore protein, alpha/beta type n=1 Tax=Priestia megaterium TaxID=1404 RepID=UPI003CFD20A0